MINERQQMYTITLWLMIIIGIIFFVFSVDTLKLEFTYGPWEGFIYIIFIWGCYGLYFLSSFS